ncbi:hypothetical protein [Streptomyces sp. MN13]
MAQYFGNTTFRHPRLVQNPSRFQGEEAHERMDRLARKYLGSERFEWIMPGEQRVAVIVRPVKVRYILGVERFRPGGPVRADRHTRHGRRRRRLGSLMSGIACIAGVSRIAYAATTALGLQRGREPRP